MTNAFHGGQLQAVVVTVRAGGELRDGAESGISGVGIRKRSEAPVADGLIAVHLGEIGLVYSASAYVLCVDASGGTQFVFQTKTPLQEIWGVKFSIRHCGDGDGRKTRCGVRLCRRAGKLALRKSQA